jgi:hypothetical protein
MTIVSMILLSAVITQLQFNFFFSVHTLINVECRAWAKNIEYVYRGKKQGYVHFEIMID